MALLEAARPTLGPLLAPLKASLGIDAVLVTWLVICIAALAVSAISIPVFVQRLLHLMTRQQRQAEALEASQRNLAEIAANALDAIVMLDSERRITFWNPAAQKLFRASVDIAADCKLARFIKDRDQFEDLFGGLTGDHGPNGETFGDRRKLMAVRADGSEFRAHLSVRWIGGAAPRYVCIIRDVTAEHDSQRRLQVLASTDDLTGAMNRRALSARASEEVERARRYGRPLSLMVLDLDNFKQINDTLGHSAGDEALRRFAQTVTDALRSHDLFGRTGGDEFMIVLPETRVMDADALATRLRRNVASMNARYKGKPIDVAMSIGITDVVLPGTHDPRSRTPSRDVLNAAIERADGALYEAKHAGRNRSAVLPATGGDTIVSRQTA